MPTGRQAVVRVGTKACPPYFCWSVRPAVHIAVFVAAIGAIHEATEIITHSHAFETEDVIVNAIGALIGVVIQRTMQRAITQ